MKPSIRALIPALLLSSAALAVVSLQARPAPLAGDTISIQASRPGASIAPTMFGIFFEDINFAADGGLYPERIKNRSFEFDEPLAGWARRERGQSDGELTVRTDLPLRPTNPHYLRIRVHAAGGGFAAVNSGFRGIGVQAGTAYVVSTYARRVGNGPTSVRVVLVDERGTTLAETKLDQFTSTWGRHEAVIVPTATAARAQFQLIVDQPGDLDLDMVSLFPKDTWKGRANGLRTDLVQLLADMKPGFLRFPGGCIVEGRRLALRYQWKKTVGDVIEREGIINRWADENDRIAPDYYQSFGLGFYEYFLLAEDIGASPLPILNCGMACQFNSGEMAAVDDLQPYIQDALDLIEFANGPVTSTWGGLRARMGHPEPFGLKMLGVGNEQWGSRYIDRYKPFAAAIKAKHPEIQLVGSAGPSPAGPMFDYLWPQMRTLQADYVDEHYYMPPTWFLDNATRYDTYPRTGPKVFAGEYAAHTAGVGRPQNRNNWEGALAEAAYLTGLERNADVVRMASYAPLFAHVDAWQWNPDLIWFDNLRSFGTPSYYVQQVFGRNVGTKVLPVAINGAVAAKQNGLYASASYDDRSAEVIVKVVNTSADSRPVTLQLDGVVPLGPSTVTTLAHTNLQAENTLDAPTDVAPRTSTLQVAGPSTVLTVPAQSVSVFRVPVRK